MRVLAYRDILKKQNLEEIRGVLENKGVIIYPTDTLYGLGGNFLSPEVGTKIDSIKGRKNMPYSVAVSDLAMLEDLVDEIPEAFYDLYKSILPGKFTFLFKASRNLNKQLVKKSEKIGVRIPAVPRILKMIAHLKFPLISTSVNTTGQPPLRDPEEIRNTFPDVNLLIDAGVLEESSGSTIIDLTKSPYEVIRKGDDYRRLNHFIHFFKTESELL